MDDWSQGRQLLLQRSKHRALSCLNEREYSRAFAHFIVLLTVEPEVKGEILNAFLYILEKITVDFETEDKLQDVLMYYEQALEVLPHDSHVLHGIGTLLFRLGHVKSALSYFLKSYQENPFFTPSLYCMENLKNALVERWHFSMLNDVKRNTAYFEAIKKAVKAGHSTVLDIGAGTGILSMMAVDAGFGAVYACEASEIMFAVLQTTIKENTKAVTLFPKFSSDLVIPIDLPTRVSLVVTEIFDAALFGEHILETLNHAWKNLLQSESERPFNISDSPSQSAYNDIVERPLSKVIPRRAIVFAVPVTCQRIQESFRLKDAVLKMFELNSVEILPVIAIEEPYSCDKVAYISGGYRPLSDSCPLLEVNFNSPEEIKNLLEGRSLNVEYKCHTAGSLDAFIVWFHLYLDEEIMLSTAPEENSNNSCWEQAIYYAFPQLVKDSSTCVSVGDTIEAGFLCKGHLTLESIKTSTLIPNNTYNQTLYISQSLIPLLNSITCENVIAFNPVAVPEETKFDIIDISTFPIIGLNILKNGDGKITVLRSQFQKEIEDIRDVLKISEDKIIFKSYEELYSCEMQCDALLVDPVELCGLLKKNVFEDVTLLRSQCLKKSGRVIPGNIEIHVMLIESCHLLQQAKVISDEKTVGYKISHIMNAYKCRVHQDIQFSTLPHKKLSEAVVLHNINLNTLAKNKTFDTALCDTIEIEIINDGKMSAIMYWFTLQYGPGFAINTADPNSLWKQAACVLDEEIPVNKAEKLILQWTCRNSCFDICIKG